MFIIIVVVVFISFIVLLNCLYLKPQVLPFVHFSSPSHWGGRGGVSEQLSSAWLPAAGLNHDTKTRSQPGAPVRLLSCVFPKVVELATIKMKAQ